MYEEKFIFAVIATSDSMLLPRLQKSWIARRQRVPPPFFPPPRRRVYRVRILDPESACNCMEIKKWMPHKSTHYKHWIHLEHHRIKNWILLNFYVALNFQFRVYFLLKEVRF